MSFDRDQMQQKVQALAGRNVFIGTSSWKYPGWCGMLYDAARYEWRGKFALNRFEKACLAEYAEVFKTVGVDASYYAMLTSQQLQAMASLVPAGFLFGFKVTDEITLKKFPNLPRFGTRAGQPNPYFLDAEHFTEGFLGACEEIRSHIGVLIFEFSRFHADEYDHGRDFIADLDAFLGKLPRGWPYAVEIRNRQWLQPEYFACLAAHKVTHVLNSWDAMPPISEQLGLPEIRSNPEMLTARFLLKPGRKYENAVKTFTPYNKVQEINDDARRSGGAIIHQGLTNPGQRTFIFVNNRMEGNALETIEAMVALAEGTSGVLI